MLRTRSCTNPSPKHDGKDCQGSLKQTTQCKIKECPGNDSMLLNFT